ncbi:hypothetical protein LCGC14_2171180, partial [marine sediment metagenome]
MGNAIYSRLIGICVVLSLGALLVALRTPATGYEISKY